VGIIRCHFLSQIGARLQIGQKDFAELVSREFSERNGVFEDLKRDAGQSLLVLAVILQDSEAGHLLVDDGDADSFACNDIRCEDFIRFQVSGRTGDLDDPVGAGLDLIEIATPAKLVSAVYLVPVSICSTWIHSTRQIHAGIGVLIDAQGSIGFILKCDFCLFAINHFDIAGGSSLRR
jgi:hypothetical protein